MLDFDNVFLTNNTIRFNNFYANYDTLKRFIKNFNTQPLSWHYRTKSIFYKCNRFNYRTDEFENIKWDESIVLLGCSQVFGVGLAEDETISAQIKNLTGKNTVNMGIGGASMFHSIINVMNLLNRNIQPLAIVNIWTQLERFLYFKSEGITNIGSWVLESDSSFDKKFFKIWTHDSKHIESMAILLQQNYRLLCKNINHYECTFFQDTHKLLNVDLLEEIDQARDLLHVGPMSAKKAAFTIVENLHL